MNCSIKTSGFETVPVVAKPRDLSRLGPLIDPRRARGSIPALTTKAIEEARMRVRFLVPALALALATTLQAQQDFSKV